MSMLLPCCAPRPPGPPASTALRDSSTSWPAARSRWQVGQGGPGSSNQLRPFGDGTCSRWVSFQSSLEPALPSSLWAGKGEESPRPHCCSSSSDTHTRVCTRAHALSLPPSLCTLPPALRVGHKAGTQGRWLPLANFEARKMFLALCPVLLGTLNSQGACGGHEQW